MANETHQDRTPSQCASFNEEGFVVVRGLLNRSEIIGWRKSAEAVMAIEIQQQVAHSYHKVIFSIHQLSAQYDCFEPLVRSPRLANVASALVGQPVRVLLDQLICKRSASRATIPHQDSPFLPLGEQSTINCWIPLADVDGSNGALIYYPGSQCLPTLSLVHLDGQPGQLIPESLGYFPRIVPMTAGDCVFHGGHTIHAATANQTNVDRYAISVQYMPEGSIAFEPIHPFMHALDIRPGAKLDHDCFVRPYTDDTLCISKDTL